MIGSRRAARRTTPPDRAASGARAPRELPRLGRSARSARLAHVFSAPRGFPRDGLPQVALMGRSNVGKSSLLNRLVGRSALARVSKTPGRTREIHFYELDEALYVVDLPGFGYARVSRDARRAWGRLVEGYLDSDPPLRLAVQLVDARHDPTPLDVALREMLVARGIPSIVVLTKGDKLSGSTRPRALSRARRTLRLAAEEPVLVTSARSGRGVRELGARIAAAIRGDDIAPASPGEQAEDTT